MSDKCNQRTEKCLILEDLVPSTGHIDIRVTNVVHRKGILACLHMFQWRSCKIERILKVTRGYPICSVILIMKAVPWIRNILNKRKRA